MSNDDYIIEEKLSEIMNETTVEACRDVLFVAVVE